MEIIYSLLHSGFSAIVPFIILLGILIFVHELGHFLVAKYFGVRVEIFSLGFGPKLLQYKSGDTVYCLSAIPLGGYVKMYGDEISAAVPEDQKQFSFTHKPVGQRIAVVLAGPLMNFFFAAFLLIAIAMNGEEVRAPFLGDIEKDTAAYAAGFRSGDKIAQINGKTVLTWDDFQAELNRSLQSSVNVIVNREGTSEAATITATPTVVPNPNVLSLDDFVGDIVGVTYLSRGPVIAVSAGSVAEKAGFKSGDRLVKINGQELKFLRLLESELSKHVDSESVTFTVDRLSQDQKSKETLELNIPNFKEALKAKSESANHTASSLLGFDNSDIYIGKVVEGSPAFAAGLRAGDKVISINEVTPQRWEDILSTIKSFTGTGSVKFFIQRGPEQIKIEIVPQMTSQMISNGSEEKRFTVGIIPLLDTAIPELLRMPSPGFGEAFVKGSKKTVELSVMTVVSFLRLAQAKISPKNIGGPLSIGQIASESFKMGWLQFFQIMSVISINLFILNLLPIPVLDGGHLLFYTVEAIRGAPVSMRKMEIAQQVGLVLLMSLMVFALFNDFSRLFS
jgi:regulator of sigma E protease